MTSDDARLLARGLYKMGTDARVRLDSAPRSVVSELAKSTGVHLSDDDVEIAVAVMTHNANLKTVEFLEGLREAAPNLADVHRSAATTSLQAIVMEAGLVVSGLAVMVAALYSSMQGNQLAATFLGGVSILTFAGIYIFDPLHGIQRALASSVQVTLAHHSFLTQVRHWKAYEAQANTSISPIVLAELRTAEAHSMWLLERYVEGRDIANPVSPAFALSPFTDAAVPGNKFVVETLSETVPYPTAHMPPPKFAMDAATRGPMKGTFVSEKQIVMDYPIQAPSPGETPSPGELAVGHGQELPFSLATSHQTENWMEHDSRALQERLVAVEGLIERETDGIVRTKLEQERETIAARLQRFSSGA